MAQKRHRRGGEIASEPKRIFLCHSWGNKGIVREFYEWLRKQPDVRIWFDEVSLLPGQNWQREIRSEVRASDMVIVCLSREAVQKRGYVHKEIRIALDEASKRPEGSIYIVPVKLDDCEVPSRLARWHCVELANDKTYSQLKRLLRQDPGTYFDAVADQEAVVSTSGLAARSGKSPHQSPESESIQKLLELDTVELEIGYGLVRLVDTAKGGDLLERIMLIRKQIAVDLGIIVPPVRIRDNMRLATNDYTIKIKGQTVARGETYPEQYMAMDNGATSGPIPGGTLTTEPAFGLPAYWVTAPQRGQAEILNYTVVEATAVLATHLTEVVKAHAHELLTRQEVKNLIENLKVRVPALVEEVLPTQIKPGELQKVMQNLLRGARPSARPGDDPRNARRLLVAH
jgi:hypothetical protein